MTSKYCRHLKNNIQVLIARYVILFIYIIYIYYAYIIGIDFFIVY